MIPIMKPREQTICHLLLRCKDNNNKTINIRIRMHLHLHHKQTDNSRTNKIVEEASRPLVGTVSVQEETECEIVISLVIFKTYILYILQSLEIEYISLGLYAFMTGRKIALGAWRNGSASDSRSEGWVFESLRPHTFYILHFFY